MDASPHAPRKTPAATLLSAVAAALLVLAPVAAQADDSDDSRLGARAQKIGTTQRDDLDPPEDGSDWRYLKLTEATAVEIDLRIDADEKTAHLKLTEAAGDPIDSVESDDGRATLRRELEPGIYYFEVRADSAISYSVTLAAAGD